MQTKSESSLIIDFISPADSSQAWNAQKQKQSK